MPRTGDILGYARVSTPDQDLSGQRDRLNRTGSSEAECRKPL